MTWKCRPLALILALAMTGCGQRATTSPEGVPKHGRYGGVGLYGPTKQWTRLLAAQQAADPQLARPIDDQVIIVVQDSMTGDVRACGDLTGYCIGMNPWKTALVSGQIAPVKVTAHVTPDTEEVAPAKAETHRPGTSPPAK